MNVFEQAKLGFDTPEQANGFFNALKEMKPGMVTSFGTQTINGRYFPFYSDVWLNPTRYVKIKIEPALTLTNNT